NGTYTAGGTQFNGLSEGEMYGDEGMASTNFPLIRIVNNGTGHVFYSRTFNHSNRSIAPGAASSTNFKVAAATELGASTLVVVATGIPSVGTPVTVGASCPGALAATHDFDHNAVSDVLLLTTANGVGMWLMNSSAAVASALGVGTLPSGWSIVG